MFNDHEKLVMERETRDVRGTFQIKDWRGRQKPAEPEKDGEMQSGGGAKLGLHIVFAERAYSSELQSSDFKAPEGFLKRNKAIKEAICQIRCSF